MVENDCPLLRFTYQVVLDGKSNSVNVTVKLTGENATNFETGLPLTAKEPEGVSYNLPDVDIE